MTLGQRLAQCRKQKGMTQQQLGEMINVSAQAISKWENDQAEPDVTMLATLSGIYETPIDVLIKGESEPPAADEKAEKPSVEEAPKQETPKKVAPAPKRSHKKLFALLACIAIILSVLTVLAYVAANVIIPTLLAPCSMKNFERIEIGMTMEEVEEMLGAPHEKVITKSIGGHTFESTGNLSDSFMEGLLEGVSGESAKIKGATYYYYGGEYGRTAGKITKLTEELLNTDLDDEKKIERLETELEELNETLETLTKEVTLKILFNSNGVTNVYYSDGETTERK